MPTRAFRWNLQVCNPFNRNLLIWIEIRAEIRAHRRCYWFWTKTRIESIRLPLCVDNEDLCGEKRNQNSWIPVLSAQLYHRAYHWSTKTIIDCKISLISIDPQLIIRIMIRFMDACGSLKSERTPLFEFLRLGLQDLVFKGQSPKANLQDLVLF